MRVFCCLGLYADAVTEQEVAELREYLGEDTAGQWSDAELARTYEAERSDQRLRCRIPQIVVGGVTVDAYPASLLEALFRRVARNLAMRKVPLGIAASADGVDLARVGSTDPEIRRLEGPYRPVVI